MGTSRTIGRTVGRHRPPWRAATSARTVPGGHPSNSGKKRDFTHTLHVVVVSMGRNPIDRYLTTCASHTLLRFMSPRNCAEVRILQEADETDVPSTTDIPPDATSSSVVVGDVPAAAPVEPQNEGGTSPSAGSHGKTIVGYYAVSSGPTSSFVRSFVRRDVIVQHVLFFSLTFSTTITSQKSRGNGTTGTTRRRPRAWTLRKYKGVRFLLSLCCRAQLVYHRSCTVLLRWCI